MKFVLLYSYDPQQTGPTPGELSDWLAFDKDVRGAGAYVYEAGFQSANTAQTVSVREGRVATASGAVASAGDVLAGFYVLDVSNINEALRWAQQIPTAKYGKVEVRPIVEYSA